MEGPDYGGKSIVHPSEDTRIYWTREYLERAKQAYAQAGGTYTLSKSEEKAADFDTNTDEICKIIFSMGGYFGGSLNFYKEVKKYVNYVGLSECTYLRCIAYDVFS